MLALDLIATYDHVITNTWPTSVVCWPSRSVPLMPQLYPSLLWSDQVPLAFRTRSACLQCKRQSTATGLFLQTILFQSHTPLKVRLQLTRPLLLHKQCHLDWSGAIILLHSLLSALLERLQALTASGPITAHRQPPLAWLSLGRWF